ncbi:hypothetical protein CHS0354_015001 [Potamilus streckersoni]|uniref:Phorbol-ester/DAG-type domain-containing protein n=1 Tax=Potamilus streckersoni TaxID=2493646 RepID=A0AAE0SMW6_9BIVA|nr:hypothetical protein CHS0354_015001 [Potamilus streckersoni]
MAQRIARAGSSTDLDVRGSLHLEKMLMLDEEVNDLTMMRGIGQTRRLVKRDVFHTWSLFTNLLSAQLCIQCNRRILVKRATYRCSACKSMVHLRCRVHATSAICPLKQPVKTFKQDTCTEYNVGEQYSSTEFLSLPRNDPTKRKGKAQLQSPYSKWGSKNHAQKNRSDTESALKTKYKQVKGGIKRTMRSFRSKVNKAKETLSESFTKHEAFKDGGDSFLSFIENERKCEEMDILDSEGGRGRQLQSDRGYQGFRRNHSKPKLESETQIKEKELDQEMDCSDDPQSHQRDSFKRHEFQCDHDIDLILDRLDEVEVKVQRLEAKIPEELECWRKLVQVKYRNEDEMDAYFKNNENDDDIQTNNSESENMHSLDSGSIRGSDSDSHNSDPAFIIHNSGLSAKQASIRPAKQMDLPLQPRQLNFRLQKDTKQAEKDRIKEKTTSTPINGHGIFLSPNESGKSAIRVKNITHFVMDKTEKTILDHRRAQTENGFGIQNKTETHRVLPSNCNTRQKEYKDTHNKTGLHRDIVKTEEGSNTRQKEYKDTCYKTGQHRDNFKTEEGKGDLLMYEDDIEEHRKRKDAFKQGLQIVLQNFARGKLDYDASVRSIKQAGTWSRETNKVDDDFKVKEEYTTAKASPNPLASSTIGQDSGKLSMPNPSSPFSVTFRTDESLFETGHSISYSNISVKSSPKKHSGGTDSGNLHKVFISPDQNKSGKLHADSVEAHVSKESVERVKVCSEEISLTHLTDLPVGQTFNSFCCDWPVKSKTCKSDSSLAGAAETYISKFCASKEYFEHQIGESKGTAHSAYQKSEQYFEQQSIKSNGISQSAYQKSKEYFEKMNLEHMESNQVNIDKKGKDNHDRLSLKRQSSGGYGKPVMVISPNQGNDSQDKSPSSFTSMGLQSLIEDLERHLPFSTRSLKNLSSPRGEATEKLECNYVDKGYKEQGKGVIDCMKHWSLESDKHSLDVKLHVETGTEEIASTKNKGDGSLAQSSAGSKSNKDSWGFGKSEQEKREIVPKIIPDVEDKFSDLVLYMTDSSVQAAKCELQESANESEERFSGRSVVDKPPYPGKVQRKKSQNIGIQATEFGAYRGKERSSNAKYHFLNSTGMVKICSPKLKLLSENLTAENHAIIENPVTSEDPLENELQTISSNSRHHCRDDQDTEQKKNNLIEESDNNLCTDESDEIDSESDKIEKSSVSQCSSDEGQGKQQIDHKAPQIVDTNYEELPSGWEITCKKGVISEDHDLVDIHNSADKATDSMEISSSPDTNGDFLEHQGEKILDGDGTLHQAAEMMHHMEVSTSLDQNLMTKEMSQTSESGQQSEDGLDDGQEAEEMAQLDQFNEILDEGLQSFDPILQWVQTQEFNSHVPEFRMMLTPKMDPCDNQTHFRNMSPSERGFQLPEMILFEQSGIEPTFLPSPDIGGDNKAVNPALEGCNKTDTLQDKSIDFNI